MKLAVISDTHGILRPELLAQLEGVDAILHAGDVDTPAVLDRLRDHAPVYAVLGNNDWRLAPLLPPTRVVQLAGLRFLLVHDRRNAPHSLEGIDVVVYGHSHRYTCGCEQGVLWLNPGSCSLPRFSPEPTMALAEADGIGLRVEKVLLAQLRP